MSHNLVAKIRGSFPRVHGTPTHVLKCGDFPPDQGEKLLYLIIPGNPGIIGFYHKFMKTLYRAHNGRIPVWGVAHAGHVILPDDVTKENSSASKEPYGLEDQIAHKIAFIKEHVPPNTRLILIGHSIGCYMILNILKQCPEFNVLKAVQLLPTFEYFKETPNGIRMKPLIVYFRWLAYFAAFLLSFLPDVAKLWLVKLYFWGQKLDEGAVEATLNMFNPKATNSHLYMATHEIAYVREPDLDNIRHHLNKLIFYYGVGDGWAPVSYYQRMKTTFPQGDIQLCERGIKHAFCLEHSAEMAGIVAGWIEQTIAPEGGRPVQ